MTTPAGGQPEPLQFDSAEPAAPGAAPSVGCTLCKSEITMSYHMANQAIICSSCRGRLERELNARSGAGRMGRAVLYGLGGAAIGAAIYYAVLALTNMEIGLIAIVVGYLVGRGVHKGAAGRGGWAYQTLAVGLTYFAIVSTYVPFIVRAVREQAQSERAAGTAAAPAAAKDSAVTVVAGADSGSTTAEATPTDAEAPAKPAAHELTLLDLVKLAGLLLGLAAVAPFLAGFENIIGLLIIGFALYQAWKMNKRVPISITGPYQVRAATT